MKDDTAVKVAYIYVKTTSNSCTGCAFVGQSSCSGVACKNNYIIVKAGD